jgi:glycine reductase complex component B subunit alpha and beta
MRLELANFPVKDVRFNGKTSYNSGVLEINKEELLALVLEDGKVAWANLDVAFPGERTRIVRVRDVVEPRVKVSGAGCVFPGILGPVETVGQGRTHRLSGVTVMTSAEYKRTIVEGTAAGRTGFVDMWGPAAPLTPFGSAINIALMLELRDGVAELEAHAAIQSAELRVAQRLAETTRESSAEDTEVFELFETDPSLPRVVYILGCRTAWHEPHSGVAYYGLPIRESLPTFLHPNEFLDGALTSDARRGGKGTFPCTWVWMNHPVVVRLLREHGKRLNFLGVILQRTRFESDFGKQVTAACASQMARLLKADGAVITRIGPSGNNFIDVMLTVQACERKGVRTVFMTPEWGGREGTELPLIFYVPEASAMVTTGSLDQMVTFPAPSKVIGVGDTQIVELTAGDPPISPWSSFVGDKGYLQDGIDWWGGTHSTCKVY